MLPLASYIEHTLLKPDATFDDISKHCLQANEFKFIGVCINPSWLELAHKILIPEIKRVTVIGFPLGATSSEAKAAETKWCVEAGADEIDMVLSIGQFKSNLFSYVREDIKAVVQAAKNKPVKVIIETGLLTKTEIATASGLVIESGAQYVKTCTGFSPGQATPEDIALIRHTVGAKALIKASGGIRTPEAALALIQAGANRLGTSQGPALCAGQKVGPAGAGY